MSSRNCDLHSLSTCEIVLELFAHLGMTKLFVSSTSLHKCCSCSHAIANCCKYHLYILVDALASELHAKSVRFVYESNSCGDADVSVCVDSRNL